MAPRASVENNRIADRLAAARVARFTGRGPELEAFRTALAAPSPVAAVLWIHGPGGIGKSTLLREFSRIAETDGRSAFRVDARDVQPSRQAFSNALADALGSPAGGDHNDLGLPPRCVLFIDTYEALSALDAWMRETFLPTLAADVIVVIAGREPPSVAWRTDVGWPALMHVIELRNFSPSEGAAFLEARGVPAPAHSSALRFTHGHPLALSLVADVLALHPEASTFDASKAPDVVGHLLGLFLLDPAAGRYRETLEVCAIARATTEPMLTDIFGDDAGRAAFAWLRAQSFIESSDRGLFPHDLVREILLADLQWRDFEQSRKWSARIFVHLQRCIANAVGRERQRLQLDALYVVRVNRTNREFFDWQTLEDLRSEPATAADVDYICRLIERHESAASAQLARAWLDWQPQAFRILRRGDDTAFGFFAVLTLGRDASDGVPDDPAVVAARGLIDDYGPLRGAESALYLRWWLDADAYQAVSAAINLTAMHVVSACVTQPGVAWNFVAMADPDHWAPHFRGVNFVRAETADFEVGGRRYGVFAHDWRVEPPADWMLGRRTPMPFGPRTEDHAARHRLSEAEFQRAVRSALRDYARVDRLAENALCSAVIVQHESHAMAKAAALQAVLREAVEYLRANPKDTKLYRAVWHTYFEPAPTQELAAERLGLPFSTYRHHLGRGMERIVAFLWQRERSSTPASHR